jgi:protocatechuate 3,4-dioxygenase beta subunit
VVTLEPEVTKLNPQRDLPPFSLRGVSLNLEGGHLFHTILPGPYPGYDVYFVFVCPFLVLPHCRVDFI